MADTGHSADTTFWQVNSGSKDYWSEYESMRPNYAHSSFLELIYDYHASKPGTTSSFDVAHDVACGSGKAAIEICKRFNRVVASDSNASSLEALQRKLTLSASKIQFEQCTAENLGLHFPPASADLIAAAECFPLLDSATALASFARMLKPNGTLAIWFYGRAHFTEPTYKAKCQPIFDRIMSLAFGKVIKSGSAESKITWKRAAEGMASWLDNVDLSTGRWDMIQRRKWNTQSTRMGFGAEAVDFDVEPKNMVKASEKMIDLEDTTMWEGRWNVQGVMKYVSSSFPGVEETVETDAEIGRLFEELKEEMGGEGATRLYTWPIVLILANRSAS